MFRSSGIARPIIVMIACGVLARASARVSRLVAAVIAISVLPVGAYSRPVKQLPVSKHPLRSTSECVQRVQAQSERPAGSLRESPGRSSSWHPLYYYFRRIQPWIQSRAESDAALNRYLYDPAEWRPMLIDEQYYRHFIHAGGSGVRPAGTSPAMITAYDAIVLLPGPYAACSPEAHGRCAVAAAGPWISLKPAPVSSSPAVGTRGNAPG